MRGSVQSGIEAEDCKEEEGCLMPASSVIGQGPRRPDVVRLLMRADLPTSDLTDEHMADFFYAGPAMSPTGIVGVQFFGSDVLLRSLVVDTSHRTSGLGSKLVEHAERHARERGANTVYLLTTTAESFFRARGYVPTPRDHAPAAIRSTPEFTGLCPASSAFLSKQLL